jgi:hypothetical protein
MIGSTLQIFTRVRARKIRTYQCQDICAEASPPIVIEQSQELISSLFSFSKGQQQINFTAGEDRLLPVYAKARRNMALLSTLSDFSALSSLVSWKTTLIVAFALLNRKSLPFAWTVRTQSYFQPFK